MHISKIAVLQRIWIQQFYVADGIVHRRSKQPWGLPPAHVMIASPEGLEASYCVKRSTEWIGYKGHITETCDPEQPRLITQIDTTTATKHDVKCTEPIQEDLAARELLPETHMVDQGYMEVDLLVKSQDKGIDLGIESLPSIRTREPSQEHSDCRPHLPHRASSRCMNLTFDARIASARA